MCHKLMPWTCHSSCNVPDLGQKWKVTFINGHAVIKGVAWCKVQISWFSLKYKVSDVLDEKPRTTLGIFKWECPAGKLEPLRHIRPYFCTFRPYRYPTLIIYSYFEKGCRIKCTRQPRKVLWVVLSSLFFREIWKNGRRGSGHMSVSAKGKQQK